MARMALLVAGLPVETPGNTVNRLCASGMDAVGVAGRGISTGDFQVAIAGGVESMSRAPFVMPKAENAFARSNQIFDTTNLWRSFFGGKVPPCGKPFPVTTTDGTQVGQITSGIFSPRLDCNVGLSMILRSHWDVGTSLVVHTPDGMARDAIVSVLPFGYV